ncbi:MAG: ATP-dependent helicase HrpB [Acidimicrobiales bacterium]
MDTAPIESALAEVVAALAGPGRAVLVAPPGTGKTTRAPLAALAAGEAAGWLAGRRILLLEPRRIAARAAAGYMASLLGEPVGRTVGYRTRGDSSVGPATRIEVVTERLLTRRVQADPSLDDVGLVIFDEVHERSLDTDLGLALCLDVAGSLRPDLRLLAMSATPDVDALRALLAADGTDAPVIESAGVAYPVDTVYLGLDRRRRLDDEVADAVTRALRDSPEGDVLVFLPGRREIRWTAERLAARGVDTVPLTAGLDAAGLQAALQPRPDGRRKVVLATSVAQTSLTIDGVRVVVDAGLERSARFDPARGMSGLVTVPVSQSAADQRRGRAGRQAPGRCYRMWTEAEHARRRPQSEPEIDVADLASLVLDVAAWGVGDPAGLTWPSPPPPAGWAVASATLRSIGAVGDDGRITADGRRISELGAHPRLGRLMLDAGKDVELGSLLAAVIEAGVRGDLRRAVERPDRETERVAQQWRRRLGSHAAARDDAGGDDPDLRVGALVAAAFPEWVARRRDGERHRYLTVSGVGVVVPAESPLAGSDWLAIAELDRVDRGDQRVVSGAPLSGSALDGFVDAHRARRAELTADRSGVLTARTVEAIGAIVLRATDAEPDRVEVVAAAAALLVERGAGLLGWTDGARELQQRVAAARLVDERVPDLSDARLAATAGDWLGAHLPTGARVDLRSVAVGDVLAGLLGAHRATVDALAPTHLDVPSGRRHRIEYGPDGPFVRVKLQEMFGAPASPTVGGGRVPVTLHLLSPAGRPLQVTQDLASFWAGAYTQVKGEMRGRYPKHPWPDDPTAAVPTATVTRPRPRR